jgi:hypothetical protein
VRLVTQEPKVIKGSKERPEPLVIQEPKEYREFRVRLAQLEPRATKVILEPLEQPEPLVTQEHKEYKEYKV